METLQFAERSLLEEKQEARDVEYDALSKDSAMADVIMYGVPTREGRIRQMDALISMERKIPKRLDRSHVMLVSANVLTMAIMASQLSMHRWRVTEAQTLEEATALLQEQVTRAKNMGHVVKRDLTPAVRPDAASKTASGGAPPTQRTADQCGIAAPEERPQTAAPAAEEEEEEEERNEKEPTSPCSSVCSAECEEEQSKPIESDTIAHLVVIDVFTHDPFDITLQHLRYFDREHGLNLVIVLMLYESYNGHAPGVVVLPKHSTTINEAYEMGFDLVIRRIFDHKVVNFFSDMFMSATGRWRNDVRRRAAVGNYRTMQDLLFGEGIVKKVFTDDESQLMSTRGSLEIDLSASRSLPAILKANVEKGDGENRNNLSSYSEPLNGTLSALFSSRYGRGSGKANITSLTIANDATGCLMQPASTVKRVVRRRCGKDGENDEEFLVDEAEEIESAHIAEYRREIARLVEEVEQGKRNLALLQQELSQETNSRRESFLERKSSGDESVTGRTSPVDDDDRFPAFGRAADGPMTLTKEQQIFMLKRRLTQVTEQLEVFGTTRSKRVPKMKRNRSTAISTPTSLASLSPERMRTQFETCPSDMDEAAHLAAEALAQELESRSDSERPRRAGRSNKKGGKKGRGSPHLDYNKAREDIISSLVKEVVGLRKKVQGEPDSSGKYTHLSSADGHGMPSLAEQRHSNAMELVKMQRSHIEFLEERLAEKLKESKRRRKRKNDIEADAKDKAGGWGKKFQGIGPSPTTDKKTKMKRKQQQEVHLELDTQKSPDENRDVGETGLERRPTKEYIKETNGEGFVAAPPKRRSVNYKYKASLFGTRDVMLEQTTEMGKEERDKVATLPEVIYEEGAPLSSEFLGESEQALSALRSQSNAEQYLQLRAEHVGALRQVDKSLHSLRSLLTNESVRSNKASDSNTSGGAEESLQTQVFSAARDYAMSQNAADAIVCRLLDVESGPLPTAESGARGQEELRRESSLTSTHVLAAMRQASLDASLGVLDAAFANVPPAVEGGKGSRRFSKTILEGAIGKDKRGLIAGHGNYMSVLNNLYTEHHKVLLRLLRLMGSENSAILHETAEHESLLTRDEDRITVGSLIPADTALLSRLVDLVERRVSMLVDREKLYEGEGHRAHRHRDGDSDSDTDNSREDGRRSGVRRHKRRTKDDFVDAYPIDAGVLQRLPEDIAQLMSRADIQQGNDIPRCLRELLESIAAEDAVNNARPSSALQRDVRQTLARLAEARQKGREETIENERRRMREAVRRRLGKHKAPLSPNSRAKRSGVRRSYSSDSDTGRYSSRTQSHVDGSSGYSSENDSTSDTIPADALRRVLSPSQFRSDIAPGKRRATLRRHRDSDQIIMAAEFGGDASAEVSYRGMTDKEGRLFPPTEDTSERTRTLKGSELPPLVNRGLTRAQQQQSVLAQLVAEGISPRDFSHMRAYTRAAGYPISSAPFTGEELAERILAYRTTLTQPSGVGASVAAHVQPSFFIPIAAQSLPVDTHSDSGDSARVATAVLSEEYTSWVYGVPAAQLAPMMRSAPPGSGDTVLFVPGCVGGAGTQGGAAATFVGRMLARLQALGTPAATAARRLNERMQESMTQTDAWPLAVIGRSVARSEGRQKAEQRAQPQKKQ